MKNLFLLFLATTAFGAERPNILLVTADDLGLQLGCYGDTIATTPALDALAKEGVRFTRGYVTQASCSPSRSSMLSGPHPHQNGQIGLSHRGFAMRDPGIPTLPSVLKEAGYSTGILGKLHIKPTAAFPFDFVGVPFADARDPVKVAASFNGFFEKADAAKPFFFMCNFSDPHEPFDAPVDGSPEKTVTPGEVEPFPFTNKPKRKNLPKVKRSVAGYYTCANRVDECFAAIMRVLEKRGLAENTIVVFIGDHGPPFPRAKVTAYNAGHHIPFLIRWPGTAPAGQTRDQMVSTIDLMPTFLKAASVEPPAGLPGRDLKPLLETADTPGREYLATEFGSHTEFDFLPQRCIQDGRWRLMVSLLKDPAIVGRMPFAGQKPEEVFAKYELVPHIGLYDLKNDPWERNNLADDPAHKEKLDELQAALLKWRRDTKDPFLRKEALIGRAKKEAGRSVAKRKTEK